MTASYSVKAHYLDASALVKLVADDPDEEPGRDALRKYYREHSNRYATSYCVTEAFSAFKLKFLRGRIPEAKYITYVHEFIRTVIGANLQIDEVSILLPIVRNEAERLIKTYKIDFLDCFQIVTVLAGALPPHGRRVAIDLDHGGPGVGKGGASRGRESVGVYERTCARIADHHHQERPSDAV